MNAVLFAVCLALSADAIETPGTVSADAFAYHAPILQGDAPKGFVRMALTGEMVDKLRSDWGDLRLADEEGRVIPYLLRRNDEGYWLNSQAQRGVCQGMTPLEDDAKAFLVDFGKETRKNRISLQEWMQAPWPVRIEGSDDKKEWVNLLDADYRIREKMDNTGALSRWIDLKEGSHRWLRIVYASGKTPVASTFTAPMLADYVPDPEKAGLIPVPLTKAEPADPSRPAPPRQSVWEWTVEFRNLPVVLVQFEVDDPYFTRPFLLEGSDDGLHWSVFLSGTIKRTHWENHAIDVLTTTRGFVTRKRLRLTIEDGDNPPLSVQTPRVWGRSGQIAFDATLPKEITLFFGNASMPPPHYDLAQSVRDIGFAGLPWVKAGEITKRPEPPANSQKSENDTMLWIALVVAVIVMFGIVMSAMFSMNRDNAGKTPEKENEP